MKPCPWHVHEEEDAGVDETPWREVAAGAAKAVHYAAAQLRSHAHDSRVISPAVLAHSEVEKHRAARRRGVCDKLATGSVAPESGG